MPQTFPNQRMVRVHRERAKTDFLGIKNENWMYASRDLGAHALRLYLYLAANADGYNLALSPADIRQRIGMPTSTYRDQFLVLVDKGYLVPNSSNGYDFYELPQTRHAILQVEQCESRGYDFENNTLCGQPITADIPKVAAQDREIYNRENETFLISDIQYQGNNPYVWDYLRVCRKSKTINRIIKMLLNEG